MAHCSISILIPTRNNERTIEACLRSFSRQTLSDFEVLVFNDASSDRTLEIAETVAKEDRRIRVFSASESNGVAVARNALLARASGEIIVFLDGDASCPEDWLEKLVRPFEDPQVGCTGGPDRLPPGNSLLSRCIDYSMHSFIASGKMRMSGNPLVRYLPAACNMAVRREILDRIGHFDESFDTRGEEKELANRIWMAGYGIVHVEDAWVWHSRRSTLSAFWRQTYLSGKVRVDIVRAAPRVFEWPHFFPAFCVALWLILALSSPFSTKVLFLWIGVTVLYGCLLLVDGVLGARKMGSTGAFFIIPVTSAVVPLAYGTGTLARLLEKR